MHQTDDVRIKDIKQLLPPVALMEKFPLTAEAVETTYRTRRSIHNMLRDDDSRLLVIVGPCSIHDIRAALEYAERLLPLREQYQDQLEIVMRVYFEKPRTTVGWKGLLNDPHLNDTYAINDGLRMARKLLLDLNEQGMPVAVEYLDMITPQYIADLVAWGAIGARTTESQVHRQLASGLSCPVGFKNGTNGNVQIAIDAIGSANAPHSFLSVTKFGHSAIVETTGNEDAHIILRGGREPNYSAQDVADVEAQLAKSGLAEKIMIDFSHANSLKDHRKQKNVAEDVCTQIEAGNQSIFGVMVESHLVEGNQKLVDGKAATYGQSITDACIGWDETVIMLERLAKASKARQDAQK
ncbi:3-deoxy-7-phosphoheptulonate synthase AroG [Suttonella sp. R2A3]|uniref:3-deoxy-7-phosphoheptulonate synthase AroG n=1 Tax=Suttonella sp. R2A3 TaxID=2908648 RepID=UPI001F30E8B2|nr:3-deoxy-7-phosphoheptulonate synthase AroG [Suttonella sp. R2A3]UJF23706.1 3-deoxy-7-phosphoheptulonate synthase AroG [Suttonella sp. R2A3]